MNKLPNGWEYKKLKDIGKAYTGMTPSTDNTSQNLLTSLNNKGFFLLDAFGQTHCVNNSEKNTQGVNIQREAHKGLKPLVICNACKELSTGMQSESLIVI